MGKLLGLSTEEIDQKDENLRGNPKYMKYKTNAWHSKQIITSKKNGIQINIKKIILKLSKNSKKIKNLICKNNIKGKLCISMNLLASSGFEFITAEQLKILSEFKIELHLGRFN